MDRLSSNPYGKAMSTETSQAAQIRQWHYEWHPGKDLRAEAEVGRGGGRGRVDLLRRKASRWKVKKDSLPS